MSLASQPSAESGGDKGFSCVRGRSGDEEAAREDIPISVVVRAHSVATRSAIGPHSSRAAQGHPDRLPLGQRDITVLGTDGRVLERIPTNGTLPTNVAFALPGQKRIHVTEYELGQIEAIEVSADGLPLFDGTRAK